MSLKFYIASPEDAQVIGTMVFQLIQEICERKNNEPCTLDLQKTINRRKDFLKKGDYSAIIGSYKNNPVAVVTLVEKPALYAGGKMGTIQEFYVTPKHRSRGVGSKLINKVYQYGIKRNWKRIEVCTPSLPEFKKSLLFYEKNDFEPAGGRKMKLVFN